MTMEGKIPIQTINPFPITRRKNSPSTQLTEIHKWNKNDYSGISVWNECKTETKATPSPLVMSSPAPLAAGAARRPRRAGSSSRLLPLAAAAAADCSSSSNSSCCRSSWLQQQQQLLLPQQQAAAAAAAAAAAGSCCRRLQPPLAAAAAAAAHARRPPPFAKISARSKKGRESWEKWDFFVTWNSGFNGIWIWEFWRMRERKKRVSAGVEIGDGE